MKFLSVLVLMMGFMGADVFAAKDPNNGDVLKPNCYFLPGEPDNDDIANGASETYNGVTKTCNNGVWSGIPNPNFENGKDGKFRTAVKNKVR